MLYVPDPNKLYELEVDASDFAIGGVLSQTTTDGLRRPCAFYSKKLHGSPGKDQVGWHIRDKEAYAIIEGLRKFRSWLISSQIYIRVETDHKGLNVGIRKTYAT